MQAANETVAPIARAGRPPEFKRKTSIEGAMNLFWRKGVSAVTAQMLAKAMGIQRSSFYNSFGNKEAVFKELCLRADDSERRGCLFCNSVTELSSQELELGRLMSEMLTERVSLLEAMFRQALAQGEIGKNRGINALALGFITFIIGINTMAKVISDEARLRASCETYLQGLAPGL